MRSCGVAAVCPLNVAVEWLRSIERIGSKPVQRVGKPLAFGVLGREVDSARRRALNVRAKPRHNALGRERRKRRGLVERDRLLLIERIRPEIQKRLRRC